MSQPRRNIVISFTQKKKETSLYTSFAQALNNVTNFSLVSSQNLVSKVIHYLDKKKGDTLSIKIS